MVRKKWRHRFIRNDFMHKKHGWGFGIFAIMLFALSLLLISPICGASSADIIEYPGDGSHDLQDDPWGWSESDWLYPGTQANPLSHDNTVTVDYDPSSGTVTDPRQVYGGLSNLEDAVNNTVEFIDGKVSQAVTGGNSRFGNAEGNTVTVNGGEIGWVNGGIGGAGYAKDNKVYILGGTINNNVFGGDGWNAEARGNIVTISGGEIGGFVVGGYSRSPFGNTTRNTVTITGGVFGGNIYGGYNESSANSIYNTVNISGTPILEHSTIYGGHIAYTEFGEGDYFSGNTLNIKNTEITVFAVKNFQFYNFWLPENTVNKSTMLIATSTFDEVDLSKAGTDVNIYMEGSSLLVQGDVVTLIDGGYGGMTGNIDKLSEVKLGATVTYDFHIYTENDALYAAVSSIRRSVQSGRALAASRLAPLAFLNQGADLVALLEYPEISRDKESRYTGFAVVTGGSSTYDTGSGGEIDVDGFSLVAGVMFAPSDNLRLSAFFEAGWGDYDMVGSLVSGSGDNDYYGAGLYARYDLTKNGPGGLYADASFRAGKIDYDFSSSRIQNSEGVTARYDRDSTYYGAHFGLGNVWKIGGRTSLDLSTKLFWTHLDSDSFTMATGDRVAFDSATSVRWRTGLRATRDATERVSVFAGAYYEYEFDGDTDGRTWGIHDIDGSSLSGGTGIGELGVIFRPSAENDRLTATLGIQGYVGTREGFSGKLALQYAF